MKLYSIKELNEKSVKVREEYLKRLNSLYGQKDCGVDLNGETIGAEFVHVEIVRNGGRTAFEISLKLTELITHKLYIMIYVTAKERAAKESRINGFDQMREIKASMEYQSYLDYVKDVAEYFIGVYKIKD